MNIGYACLTIGVEQTKFNSCRLKNANRNNLLNIIDTNLQALENIVDYNIKNNIKLFRITSDLIPFGSSSVNTIPWWDEFSTKLDLIGEKIRSSSMRVSMHPGQYTVLNSPDEDVVKRAIEDLEYHNRVLDSLGVGSDSKIILHIGGVYNDKNKATDRFISNFLSIDKNIKKRMVIENDDRSFNIEEVLSIGEILKIPVVFDNLHYEVLQSGSETNSKYWIDRCRKTWSGKDGTQKIHYSQQDPTKRLGAHSNTIDLDKFMEFISELDCELDIMLEVKDKNLSAIKCINGISQLKDIKTLEVEWSRYKYSVLENHPINYNKIRQLLKDKSSYPVTEFYKLIDNSLEQGEVKGNTINGALHVWGYFKNIATETEKNKFMKCLGSYKENNCSKKAMKNILWKLTKKYEIEYLAKSYYFY